MTERTYADEALSSLKTQLTVEQFSPQILALKSEHEARAVATMEQMSIDLLAEAFRLGFEAGLNLKSENPDL